MDRRPQLPERLGNSRDMLLSCVRLLVVGALAIACGSDDTNSDAGGAEQWPPASCDTPDSPFFHEECVEQIQTVCRSQETEEDCLGKGSVAIGQTEPPDFTVNCNWVPVVTFVDDTSCVVESTSWRCEGHVEQNLDVCADPCESGPELHYAWKAIASEREMIKMCGVPLGRWSVIGSTPGHVSSCLPGVSVTPPNPPLCDCAPAACDETRGVFADPTR
jgi:hypothetical protein